MLPTLTELADEGYRQLQEAGITNPRLAAEAMLRFLLGLRRVDLYLKGTMPVPPDAEQEFSRMISRKLGREPLQYIIGETEWYGLRIKCNPSALIPRPETEVIVEHALRLISDREKPLAVDIGTGTGCIAMAIASSRTDAQVVATDVSAEALLLASENISSHGLESRVTLRLGNLCKPLEPSEEFDLIISNPPYVRESEYASLLPEVREYEPRTALVAGKDGLAVIRGLIEDAYSHLRSGGLLVFEIGETQAGNVHQIVSGCEKYEFLEVIVDYNDRSRGIAARRL